jgi:lipopolysaccharide assembly protein A
MIRLILVSILLLLSLSFFLQNQEQEVTLRYLFGLRSASTPIYKPILSAFALGLLVASILLFPAWIRGRIEIRRKTKALQEAEADLERLRMMVEKPPRQPGVGRAQAQAEELTDE